MHAPIFLIIKPSSLGDIVHGLLVARMIKDGLPGCRIDWVCRDIFVPVVRACPFVDNVLLFQRRGSVAAFLGLIRDIRQNRYDFVLDFQGLARTGLLTLLARAGLSIGRSDAREGSRFMYDRIAPLPADGAGSHAVAILAEFLPLLGLPRTVAPFLPMHIPDAHPADQTAIPGQPILVFPESRRAEKNWPLYPRMTTSLCRALPDQPVFWAGAAAIPSPSGPLPTNFHNLTGKTSLTDLLRLLVRSRLVVGNDSGPLHLAAALNVPTLALFGPTDPAHYRPYPGDDRKNRVLRAPEGDFSRLQAQPVLDCVQDML